ncbi:hypothetical protein LZ016_14690 [Sphingomonas sp. SM33]|uniref:Calcium-binding protein n=1 Tax=Sphingomonas telluris TaxID=2907998 RepID=A0ABS9VRE5_9SPHN|nr:calcium-binding protein [Sphingomonas telluris]MCH8617343.1 hypothetical protein [Sphingomonas telluris]
MTTTTLTDGPDVFTTTWRSSEDVLFLNVYMLGGDDRFSNVGWGSLRIYLGAGNDYALINPCYQAIVYGEAGDDTVDANLNSPLTFYGGDGADRVNFLKSSFFVTIDGGPGNDSFYANNFTIGGSIKGGAGDDIFRGFGNYGGYKPTLAGGPGNDTYFVNPAAVPSLVESAGEGTDTVRTKSSYTLPTGVSIERLLANDSLSTAAINLTGNELANVINGNAGPNVLKGQAGSDTLHGLGGNDTLIGGPGNDLLYGGKGDDWIRVVSSNDGADRTYGDLGADFIELTIGDVIAYSSWQQSSPDFGRDTGVTQQRGDPWTVDFTGFDANLALAGVQKLVFDANDSTPEAGELSYLKGGLFGVQVIGLQANVDSDPQAEFILYFGWEAQAPPSLIFG